MSYFFSLLRITEYSFSNRSLPMSLRKWKWQIKCGIPGKTSETALKKARPISLVTARGSPYCALICWRNGTTCSEEMKKINNQIKSQFPFIDYCIWSGTELMPYMHHIPNLNLLFVDVEREVAESVFNLLNSDSNKRVFLMPTPTEHDRYIKYQWN